MGVSSENPKQRTSAFIFDTTMKIPFLLCVFAASLTSIKAAAADDLCDICCNTTPNPTKPSDAPTKPSDAPTKPSDAPTKSSDAPTKPSDAPTKPSENTSKASNLFMRYALTTNEEKCKEFINGNKDCNKDCSGAATFTMSVVFVLVSVIMSLHV